MGMDAVGFNTEGLHTIRKHPKCTKKCICNEGWYGSYCNKKKVEIKASKTDKTCGRGKECVKKVTVKCSCKNQKTTKKKKKGKRKWNRRSFKGHNFKANVDVASAKQSSDIAKELGTTNVASPAETKE